jgi:hypothetical protein
MILEVLNRCKSRECIIDLMKLYKCRKENSSHKNLHLLFESKLPSLKHLNDNDRKILIEWIIARPHLYDHFLLYQQVVLKVNEL